MPKAPSETPALPIRLTSRPMSVTQLGRLNAARTARGEPEFVRRDEAEGEISAIWELMQCSITDYNSSRPVPPGARVAPIPPYPGVARRGPGGRTIYPVEPPVDAARIERLVEHPDERVAIMLLERARDLRALWLADDVSAEGERRNLFASHARLMATVWPRLAERARREAEQGGLELTALGDALVAAWEADTSRGERDGLPFAPGAQTPPPLERLAAAVSPLDDEAVVMALLRARSRHVRTTVVAHARALQRPEVVLGMIGRLEPEAVRQLLANPALGAEARTAAHDWAMIGVLQGALSHTGRAIIEGLEDAGVEPGAETMRLLGVAVRSVQGYSVRTALAMVPAVARDDTLRPLLLAERGMRIATATTMARHLRGERWWQVVQLLLGEPAALRAALESATAETVAGLPPRALIPLLSHSDAGVRERAARLVGGTERGADIPEPLPEPERRRRVRI